MRTDQVRRSGVIAQRGQAFLLLVLLIAVGAGALIYSLASPGRDAIERDKKTAAALAQARDALIGYATAVTNFASNGRPGDLPCPDLNNSGITGTSCGNAAGTTGQTSRIGRLPWKSLGLPDLRDGDGERLWYAVSNNFKYNSRTSCTSVGNPGCLNSDSRGTITVRDSAGNVTNDGTNPDPFTPSGIIAVIFAPGAVLQRQGAVIPQDRSCTGGSCTAADVCTTSPASLTPKCNPVNYLDTNGTEDNANFIDGSNTNGFINGIVRDANNNIIVNDRLMVITYQYLMPVLQRRVAKEALNCLNLYAADSQNKGRYPWASSITDSSGTGIYNDTANTRFGRIPGNLTNTIRPNSEAMICAPPITQPFCMTFLWPSACTLGQGTWWTNWKNLVFYGVATPYQPDFTALPAPGVPLPASCSGNCLAADPPSASSDKRIVVMVAGKRLSSVAGGQPRGTVAEKSTVANYLEGENDWAATTQDIFTQQPASSSINDFVLFQQ